MRAAEIPASAAASFLATSSDILPAAMPPAARQSSNPGHVGLGRGSACPPTRATARPTTRRQCTRPRRHHTPGSRRGPPRPARPSAPPARRTGGVSRTARPATPPASGSLGAEGVEDPRHRNRALSHAGARLGPQRHGLVAHREHLWVSPQCIRRLLQYAAHDGAADDKTTRSIGRCRGIVVGADHVKKCSFC